MCSKLRIGIDTMKYFKAIRLCDYNPQMMRLSEKSVTSCNTTLPATSYHTYLLLSLAM